MLAPISDAKLDKRIHSFLARKDKRYPEMHLLDKGSDDRPADGAADRGDAVWFRGIKTLS